MHTRHLAAVGGALHQVRTATPASTRHVPSVTHFVAACRRL